MAKRLSTQLGKRRRVDGGDADDDDREGRNISHRPGVGTGGTRTAAAFIASHNIGLRTKVRGANPELVIVYRVKKMLKLSLCVAYGAYTRTESRGAHFREDFPRRNDAEWLNRTLATWKSENETLPSLSYEQIDVMKMELPPGWRGYGAKDHIDHPDTARRVAEIEALKQPAMAPIVSRCRKS